MVTFSCFLKLLNYSLMDFYRHTFLKKAFETHFQFISTLGDNYYLLILFFFFFGNFKLLWASLVAQW